MIELAHVRVKTDKVFLGVGKLLAKGGSIIWRPDEQPEGKGVKSREIDIEKYRDHFDGQYFLDKVTGDIKALAFDLPVYINHEQVKEEGIKAALYRLTKKELF